MKQLVEILSSSLFFQKTGQLVVGGILLVGLLSATACSRRYSDVPAYWPIGFEDYENQSVGRFKTSYLAEQIDEYYQGINPGPIGVTTFVNLDDLSSTSSFGRICGEQLMSELSMRGYEVVELRHSDALHFMSNTGEFALSRDIAAVRRERDLGGVVVGTYVVSPVRVYLNARLIDPATSMVLSAGSAEMSKTQEIAKLVRGGTISPSLERIPVKKLGLYSYPMPLVPNRRMYYDYEESMGYVPSGSPMGMGSQQPFMPEPQMDRMSPSPEETDMKASPK
ncbi:MAG: hypothetical protein KDD64_14795 [Bdellovibrionales bacterium]|nr:hypothetical protein [Bdellovibrionales bacterium]